MKLIISDANVLIDIEVGAVLRETFRLPETFAVPDILFIEELVEQHPELPGYGLEVHPLDEEAVEYAYILRGSYRRPSQMDLFALALAQKEGCPLMTGDKDLRDAAYQEGVKVHGTLWLIERLFVENILTLNRIRSAYKLMEDANRRLPWGDVRYQLKRLDR